jgi:hypothetical protein
MVEFTWVGGSRCRTTLFHPAPSNASLNESLFLGFWRTSHRRRNWPQLALPRIAKRYGNWSWKCLRSFQFLIKSSICSFSGFESLLNITVSVSFSNLNILYTVLASLIGATCTPQPLATSRLAAKLAAPESSARRKVSISRWLHCVTLPTCVRAVLPRVRDTPSVKPEERSHPQHSHIYYWARPKPEEGLCSRTFYHIVITDNKKENVELHTPEKPELKSFIMWFQAL